MSPLRNQNDPIAPGELGGGDAFGVFSQRSGRLRLFAYRCAISGEVIEAPICKGEIGGVVGDRAVRAAVGSVVVSVSESALQGPVVADAPEVGGWVVVMPERRGRRCEGFAVVLGLGRDACSASAVCKAIERVGGDADSVRAEIGGWAVHDRAGMTRLCEPIGWMFEDLRRSERQHRELSQFTDQVSTVYEQLGLVYRLGRSMSVLLGVDQFIKQTCDDLLSSSDFGWVAVRFRRGDGVSSEVRGRLYVSGRPPIGVPRLGEHADSVLSGLDGASWKLLAGAGEHAITRETGSPVLAHPVLRRDEVVGVLLAGNKSGMESDPSSFDTQLLDAAGDFLGVFVDNTTLYEEQRQLFMGTVGAMTAAVDAKDRYTFGHSERVAYLARELALAIGMNEDEAEWVRLAGLLHDVGKIGVPERVLCKEGRLTDDEFGLIKQHPERGHRILRDVPQLSKVLPGVLHHHERWDGRGYPSGLKGEESPLVARILGVADAFDAMSSTRSYRSALPRDRVLEEIRRCAGAQFDPALAAAFVQLDFAEFDRLVDRHAALERCPVEGHGVGGDERAAA